MESKNLIKGIIGVKLVVVVLALGLNQGWITLGDLPSFAEEKAKTEGEPVAGDSQPKTEGATADGASDKTKEKIEPVSDARKSFLSELFELPVLDPKSAKKEEVGKYLDMADRKGRQLKERELMLGRREAQLKNIERSIDEKLGKMDEERKYIAKTLQQEKDLKGERLEKLIALYDKMEPKKAAPQIEKLDKDLVVGLMKGLKQKQVTIILESMSPDKSVEITEYFARVKSAREYDLLKELNASLKKEFSDCKGLPEAVADTAVPAAKTAEKSVEKATDKGAVAAPDAKVGH